MASMSQARTNGANTARPSAGAQRPQPATRLDSDDHVDDSLEVIVLDEGNTAGLGAEAPGGPRDVAQPALLSPSPATGRAAFVRGASTDGVVFTMAAPAPRCAVSSFAASPRASSGASLDVNSPTSADAADGTPRTPGAGAAPAAPFSSPGADSVEARLDAYVRSSLATSGGGDGVATRGTATTATGEPAVGAEASSSAVQSAHAPRPRSAHLNGVTQRRGKWEARLQVSGRVLYLGRYATRREAEIAFSSAAFKFRQSLLRDTTAGAAARAAAASAVDELEVARSGRVSIPVCTACGRAIDPSLPGGAIASWRGSGAGVAGSPPPRLASPSAPMPLPPTAACQCLLKAPLALPKALVAVSTAPRAFTRFTIVRFKSGRFSRSLPEFVLVDAATKRTCLLAHAAGSGRDSLHIFDGRLLGDDAVPATADRRPSAASAVSGGSFASNMSTSVDSSAEPGVRPPGDDQDRARRGSSHSTGRPQSASSNTSRRRNSHHGHGEVGDYIARVRGAGALDTNHPCYLATLAAEKRGDQYVYRLSSALDSLHMALAAVRRADMGDAPGAGAGAGAGTGTGTGGNPSTPSLTAPSRRTAMDVVAAEVDRGYGGSHDSSATAELLVARCGKLPRKHSVKATDADSRSSAQRSVRATATLLERLQFWCDKRRVPVQATHATAGTGPARTITRHTASSASMPGATGVLMATRKLHMVSLPLVAAISSLAALGGDDDADSGDVGGTGDGSGGEGTAVSTAAAAGVGVASASAATKPSSTARRRRGTRLQRRLGRGNGDSVTPRGEGGGSGAPPNPTRRVSRVVTTSTATSRLGHLSQCNALVASHMRTVPRFVDRTAVPSVKNLQMVFLVGNHATPVHDTSLPGDSGALASAWGGPAGSTSPTRSPGGASQDSSSSGFPHHHPHTPGRHRVRGPEFTFDATDRRRQASGHGLRAPPRSPVSGHVAPVPSGRHADGSDSAPTGSAASRGGSGRGAVGAGAAGAAAGGGGGSTWSPKPSAVRISQGVSATTATAASTPVDDTGAYRSPGHGRGTRQRGDRSRSPVAILPSPPSPVVAPSRAPSPPPSPIVAPSRHSALNVLNLLAASQEMGTVPARPAGDDAATRQRTDSLASRTSQDAPDDGAGPHDSNGAAVPVRKGRKHGNGGRRKRSKRPGRFRENMAMHQEAVATKRGFGTATQHRRASTGAHTVPGASVFVPPVGAPAEGDLVFQFGRMASDRFFLDTTAPLSQVQAFALALCQFWHP